MIKCDCGKLFTPRPCWTYKLKGKKYCSYTCWRAAGGDNKKHYARKEKYDGRKKTR